MIIYETKTQEEYDWLMKYLKKKGYGWNLRRSNNDLPKPNHFLVYKEKTGVVTNYSSADDYELVYGEMDLIKSLYSTTQIISTNNLINEELLEWE